MTKRRFSRKPISASKNSSRRLHHETLEKRELLAADLGVSESAPNLLSVEANSGRLFDLQDNNRLMESPTQLKFRFDGGQNLDSNTFEAFQIFRSGGDGSFTDGNESRVVPGFIGFEDENGTRIVVARFAETLEDDFYTVQIAGYDDTNLGIEGLRNTDGEFFAPSLLPDGTRPNAQTIRFEVEVGPRVVAVVPQPVVATGNTHIQERSQIHVYFNADPLSNPGAGEITSTGSATDPSVVQPQFYNLFLTNDTVEPGDDGPANDGAAIQPTEISYDPALRRAVLTFSDDLSTLAGPDGEGTYRLRIGSSQPLPVTLTPDATDETNDVADTFRNSRDLGVAFGGGTDSSITISGEVEPTAGNTIQWPGIDSPGVRDDRRDAQVVGRADTTDGVNVFYYNFADLYGVDAGGNNLENAITPAQQQRAREILDLYSEYLGVQFIESENRGLQIVTGDLRALVEGATTGPGAPYQEYRVNDNDPTQGVLILEAGEAWYDGYGLSPNANEPSWFVEALRGIGNLLGLGPTFEQVPGVASGSNPALYDGSLFGSPANFMIEPDFLSTSDITPLQALHRPEVSDADLYKFSVSERGTLSVETYAQRLLNTSTLDTDLKLWKYNKQSGEYDLVARNADFYGDDSFIGIDVDRNEDGTRATYVIGITAAGNEDYNPSIANSGGGGRSQGLYEMRIGFESSSVGTIEDTNGSRLDGDSDGEQGGDFNFWFRTAKPKDVAGPNEVRTLFVSSSAGLDSPSSGTVTTPYKTIKYAIAQSKAYASSARPGQPTQDIIRLLADGGADRLIDTTADNVPYEIGSDGSGALKDGATFEVPKGVTVMVDAGAILKLQNAKISVGSETIDEDRSLAALQVLGAPFIIDQNGSVIDGTVDITSYKEERRDGVLLGRDGNSIPTTAASGDWAGIEFRNDFDYSEGRGVWETEGIFLDYVSNADIRYGGGSVSLTSPVVNPLSMLESRPTLIYNHISDSRDAAMSADPDSFEETNFNAPIYQQAAFDIDPATMVRTKTTFASDYDRVGPLVRGNMLERNTINGLFVRVNTPAGGVRTALSSSARFDDSDITHVFSEVLVLEGNPGGPQLLEDRPDVLSVTQGAGVVTPKPATALDENRVVDYRVTFVTSEGYESLSSEATMPFTVTATGVVNIGNLPAASSEFVGRRLYRLTASGDYEFVTQLDRATPTYQDIGTTRDGLLSDAALATSTGTRLLPRFDARLSIDPGVVAKFDTARIEATFGADFYAEGTASNPIVFTSRLDDRYGAGGSFDTNNDAANSSPVGGDWSGLVFRQGSSGSIDHAVISYGGGESSGGGGFAYFNPIEILQADVRVANSRLSNNASGTASGTTDYDTRDSVGFNGPATIFIRGAQPIIVGNQIVNNDGAAISVNPDALNYMSVVDAGRGTGEIDRFECDTDNQGPQIEENQLADNAINGIMVRNESLTTESVWDDTDIVHVVENSVYAWNHHHRSTLRLKSDPNQSLVVKFENGGSLNADRYETDVEDSIGGTIQVIGQPGFPVVLTSISDDSVGAGFTPDGLAQNDTDNQTTPAAAGNWEGIVINPGSNDRNVAFVSEAERAVATASALNAIPSTAQILGLLAKDEVSSDENRRLGFNVRGSLSQTGDIDVYTFSANGGTEVYFDIDDTDFGLDTVVELIDINGNIVALSDSSELESVTPSLLFNGSSVPADNVLPLYKTGNKVVENPNVLDAGMRVILPGNSTSVNTYYVRVRSSNLTPGASRNNLTNTSLVGLGLSRGQYQLSIRLQETDEIAGSTIRLADIRYATTAIDVPAAPSHSPLAGETAEEIGGNGLDVNNGGQSFNAGNGAASAGFSNGVADPLGSLNASDRGVLKVSGVLGNQIAASNITPDYPKELDLDVYRVEIDSNLQAPDVINENRFVSTIFDVDYADQFGGPNTSVSIYDAAGRLILHGRDSNIADDQGRPGEGNDPTNLSGGSGGTLDAYIGPVELQVGTYYVVVSSAQMIPASLNQLFENNSVESSVRILPVDSSRRIGEFGFDENSVAVNGFPVTDDSEFEIIQLDTAAELPTVRPLFDETSIVPYQLEDIRLFLTLDGGLSGNNRSTLISVNPFTGELDRTIGQFDQPVGDLATRRDGELFAYSLGPVSGTQNNGNTGNFLNISSANANKNSSGDDGLGFRRSNEAGTGTEGDDNAQLLINAIAFAPSTGGLNPNNNPAASGNARAYVVGNRDNFGRFGEIYDDLRRNIVYSVVETSGAATNRGSTNGNLDRDFGNGPYTEAMGAATNKQELGIVDVGQFNDSALYGHEVDAGDITGIAFISSSLVYAVTDEGYVLSFNPSDTRTVDVDGLGLQTYNRVINATNHGQVAAHQDHFGTVNFSSLTFGPRQTNGSSYSDVLFATTTDGWLYAMEIDPTTDKVTPSHVLSDGNSAIALSTSGYQITGAAFSIREENLWHVTGDLSTPFGTTTPNAHGTFLNHNQTRTRISGGSSLYFGNEIDNNAANNTLDGGNGTLNPGGASGTTVSAPFSLEGYDSGDKPTLYFTYLLETQANADFAPNRSQTDSFRVFATGDDGQWRLLATNDSWRTWSNVPASAFGGDGIIRGDEYDYFSTNGGIPVQELFENTNGDWRQARIDLSPLAGHTNVQLRFDFSTAGGMNSRSRLSGYLTEVQATAGTDVVDGSTFELTDTDDFFGAPTTFEFVRGAAVTVPDPATILNGQQLAFTDVDGNVYTVTLTTDAPGASTPFSVDVGFSRTDTADTLATAIADALDLLSPELAVTAVDSQLRVPEVTSYSITPERFGAAEILIPDDGTGVVDSAAILGQTIAVGNSIDQTTTVTLETTQDVSFGDGINEITVESNFLGFFEGTLIRLVDRVALDTFDAPPTATYDFNDNAIEVTFNSNPDPAVITPTNNDYDAIITAINNIGFFTTTLSAGVGTTPFLAPATVPQFPEDEVYYDPASTPDVVATAIANKLSAVDPLLQAYTDGARLIIPGASSAVSLLDVVSVNQGTTASQFLPSGNVPIFYSESMTVEEVRDSIRASLAEGLGSQSLISGVSTATADSFPAYGTNRIRLYNHSFDATDAAANTSSLGFSTFLPGDEFSANGSSSVSSNQVNTRPATDNAIRGVHIDDIIVGFAERGELVLNAPVNRNFEVLPEVRTETFTDTQQPEFLDEVLVGNYSLEVRSGAEYGVPEDYDPIRLELNEQLGFGRSFDTNDRLNAEGVTLIAPRGIDLVDGDVFVLSNGSQEVTFEFDSDGSIQPGRVRVPFTPVATGTEYSRDADEAEVVATSIRDAINSPQAFNILGVYAVGRDSSEVGPMTDNRVELFGESIQLNPSSGRFSKVDMVAEETFYGRETARTLPMVDHETQTVFDIYYPDSFARATVTNFVNGATDTLVAVGKIGDHVSTRDGGDDVINNSGNVLIPFNPFPDPGEETDADADYVKIYLNAGDVIDVDLDTVGWTLGTEFQFASVAIFSDNGTVDPTLEVFDWFNTAPGENGDNEGAFIDDFAAPRSGFYYVGVSPISIVEDPVTGFSSIAPFQPIGPFDPLFNGVGGDYELTIRPGNLVSNGVPVPRDVLMVDYHLDSGDTNAVRDQGQYVISSNFVRDFSVTGIDAHFVDNETPGAAATLRNVNTSRLLPGTIITNNVVIASAGTGISFSGETAAGGDSPAPVPFGRIVNNTVVGVGGGVGIEVSQSASPTVLNNIISGFTTGLDISGDSTSTIEGGNAYQSNGTNSNRSIAASSIVIAPTTPLFENPASNVYIPASGSQVIDSSFSSLSDRSSFVNTVKEPVGIAPSPIIAPSFDAYGIPRFDDPDVTTPSGVGSNVFIDRGAIDRADFVRPVAELVSPLDFVSDDAVIPPGEVDISAERSYVRLTSGNYEFFEIQLFDPNGSGPDPATITQDNVILTENGVQLVPGVDYTFGYSANSRLVRLTPLAGAFRNDAVYEITLNNNERLSIDMPAGSQIADGDQVTITDATGYTAVLEFDSGYLVMVPQNNTITVLEANSRFVDKEVFTITSPTGIPRRFEINTTDAVNSNNIEVNLKTAGTIGEVRDAIFAALSRPDPSNNAITVATFLGLTPVKVGDSQIQLGTIDGNDVSGAVAGLLFSGSPDSIRDGDMFSYSHGPVSVQFEFTTTPVDTSLPANASKIPFALTDDPDAIAEKIVAAVARFPQLGLSSAQAVGDLVLLGGEESDSFLEGPLLVNGTPGVTPSLSLTIPDTADGLGLVGSTFDVQVDGFTVTFRYTDDPAATSVTEELIVLTASMMPSQVAALTASRIAPSFAGVLTPAAVGSVVTLGEQTSSSLTTTANTAGVALEINGVSEGALPVRFVPDLSSVAIAATLEFAIVDSKLNVETFSPGGGKLLVDNATSAVVAIDGVSDGVLVPAISDLAGNPVQETRENNETRFTIIMPDVLFDFGDALNSYSTEATSGGPSHTISGNRTPRLGNLLDTETDGHPSTNADGDDQPVLIDAIGSSIFDVDSASANTISVTVNSTKPVGGEILQVTVGTKVTNFELIESTSNPQAGNVPVVIKLDDINGQGGDTPEQIASKLLIAMQGQLDQTGDALVVEIDAADSAAIQMTAVDDEDGLPIGLYTVGGQNVYVFTTVDADPANVGTNDILGFLNPFDPAGSNVNVVVTGTGLIDAWIDYDADGVFQDDEQVFANAPANDGINRLTIPSRTDDPDLTIGDTINTTMRVRISDGGNLRPGGVAIGGEVEDYIISVLPRNPAEPIDDAYVTEEDTPLVVDATSSQDDLFINDIGVDAQLIPIRYFIIEDVKHGTLTQTDPTQGYFTYTPDPDFAGEDTFTYRFSAQQNGTTVAQEATVTISVTPVNDAPIFTLSATDIDVLEDDPQTTITGFVTGAAVGPATALDEIASQDLNLTVSPVSIIPAGLMTSPPVLNANGDLTISIAPDQFGTAIYVIEGVDVAKLGEPTLDDPVTVRQTFTINVRPVNDAPIVNPALAGTSDQITPVGTNPIVDEAYSISATGEITYTLREDNTQAGGDTSQPYFIPVNAMEITSSYSRVGLVDVFLPGPPTEILDLPGGLQTVSLVDFPANQATVKGGTLTSVIENGVVVGVNYVPPMNYNSEIDGDDSFSYTVRDNGRSWDSNLGEFVDDFKEVSNSVKLKLNKVNDRPEFDVGQTTVTVAEDSDTKTQANFAFNISAGPPLTAFDENSGPTAQGVVFSVVADESSAPNTPDYFTKFPEILPNGTLSFQPAPNAFGTFKFKVVLSDLGPGNKTRGDLVSSDPPVIMTITIEPKNDPPAVKPDAPQLIYALDEGGSFVIPVDGDATTVGLLDVFSVGPGDEGENTDPGGNQTLSLNEPYPTSSASGGTLTPITDSTGKVTGLRYQPMTNFAGTDSFLYTVVDDGVSVNPTTGATESDPRIAANKVTLVVSPVNDEPIYSGASDQINDEDENTGLGRGVVRVPNWATNVQAGPAGAVDEINGIEDVIPPQEMVFDIVQVSGPTNLFSNPPSASISNGSATLAYTLAPNANGVAVFTATLRDFGPNDPANGDDPVGKTTTFSITVRPVNDAPTFVSGGDVTVLEDNGPYAEDWAATISPGPADESAQTVVFDIVVPDNATSLFSSLPIITEEGQLRFTPAANAVGVAELTVTATDSGGATSSVVPFTISITEVNDPSQPVGDDLDGSDEDTVFTIPASDLLANDQDPDLATNPNEVLTVVMPEELRSVSGALVTYNSLTQEITYNPTDSSVLQALAPGESVTDSFSYIVRDAAGVESGPVVVRLEISGVNDAPTLVADNPTLATTGATTIHALDNDFDIDGTIDPASMRIELQPAFGTVSFDANGVITYTPFASFTLQDSFSYSVADNLGLRSAPALIVIDSNAAPIAKNDFAGTFLDEPVVVDVALNDSDPDGTLNLASIQIVSGPSRGEAVPLADGTVRYIPAVGFTGLDSFTYTISDTQGRQSKPAKVDVQVVASELQNPQRFSDVNDDGSVSALDALLIINLLSDTTEASIPVEPDDRGPHYYDANGNRQITAADALYVINELTARGTIPSGGIGEGESVSELVATQTSLQSDVINFATTTTVGVIAEPDSAFALAPRPDKLVSPSSDPTIDAMNDSTDWLEQDDVLSFVTEDTVTPSELDPTLSALDSAIAEFSK
ncbi:Dockerin type I repeat protein [Planctomycetes bacterium CA13]|uniref:Dockerin type I repeat protein n=1 Tax=Novipirellula herctigrandis TaxID=2527986 RepID=A0A5C5ZBH8_9BACT|nr:Dockerin type I repeat protein [Planctomycetes bacterium CA13]